MNTQTDRPAEQPAMHRTYSTWVLMVATAISSWLGMQWVHELGHVLGAWGTGGRVAQVVLHRLTISRTDLAANPIPLAVVWAGPVGGVLLPLLMWLTAKKWLPEFAYLLRFFAGFCLLANGLYISCGSFDGVGDCGEMLRHGSAAWHLWLFGIVTCPWGLGLWHGLGAHFSWQGEAQPKWTHGLIMLAIAVLLAASGAIFFRDWTANV